MNVLTINQPYLLLIGDVENPLNAKTAFGLRDWMPEACVGQMRFSSNAVDLGLPDLNLQEASVAGAKTVVVGITPFGGQLPDSWHDTLLDALDAGFDLAAGLHQRIALIPAIAQRAAGLGRKIFDVRYNDSKFPVGTGVRRTGRRLLTVGTDCALGKKYTALAIAKALLALGKKATFRATGQTGILISGSGVAIDAVVADFIAGAAESISPDNEPDHWDIIEGQGSLFHPAYSGVSLGLLHGSQPDALVLCHNPTRKVINGFPHISVVALDKAVEVYLDAARLTNPAAKFVGVAMNTSSLNAELAADTMTEVSKRLGLPCVDPIRTGVEAIVQAMGEFDGL